MDNKTECIGCRRSISKWRDEAGTRIWTMFCPYCGTYVWQRNYLETFKNRNSTGRTTKANKPPLNS